MNHRENDTTQENEGKQVQQELEEQLRAFGNTMSDAFAHGFEGKGMDIGDRAFDVGKAAVHAANYGISEAGKAMRQARDSYYQSQRQAHANGGTAERYAGMPQWARNFFASRPELTPVEKLRKCAKERYSSGVALLAVGITFAVLFGLGTLGCLIGLGTISPAALGDGAGLHFAERCHRCDRTGWHRADAGRGSVCQCGLQHIGHHQQCTGSCHGLLWLDGGLRRFPEGSGQADGPAGRPC